MKERGSGGDFRSGLSAEIACWRISEGAGGLGLDLGWGQSASLFPRTMSGPRCSVFLLCLLGRCVEVSEGKVVVTLPGGMFHMGTSEADARDGEAPIREVTVKPFAINQHPVTNSEFREFIRSQKYKTEAESFGWSFVFEDFVSEELKSKVTQNIESAPWWLPIERAFWRQPAGPGSGIKDKMEYPVVQVSWIDAKAFCQWKGMRLPTEEEWEFAARGGLGGRVYPWGNKFQPNRTNLWQGKFPDQDTAEDGYHGVSPVNAFPPQNNYGECQEILEIPTAHRGNRPLELQWAGDLELEITGPLRHAGKCVGMDRLGIFSTQPPCKGSFSENVCPAWVLLD
ncbi:inactive C-alpha-formylglycine-generating enzyme 2 isoform X3 [Heptranchias perlo]|uniref:inactive C-alpha-formylglycine-generating enzyme 2 isoform X3 n=1 Tax=Heptranchias perlo TaxID=212740 RepID=UPI00355A63FB